MAASALQSSLFTMQEYTPFLANLAAPAVVTVLAYVLYLKFMFEVVRARLKHRIKPPAMTGHPDFERAVRVYANQLEQYIPFLTSMFLTAIFINGNLAGVLGLLWVIFRYRYGVRYEARPYSNDIGLYTGPPYALILLMYILPFARIVYLYGQSVLK